mmetsp:Transcript_59214/g.108015  ORF Transcript_59214/g.108015 Transcript_59214/m.108015 type:complete len:192 (+) Transcript_59214:56-631(+)
MSWDRGAPSPVVPNSHQAKQSTETGPKWTCTCGGLSDASRSHCQTCGLLRPEERMLRLHSRALSGMGKGGGYFERNDPVDRSQESDLQDGGLDVYGRRRSAGSGAPTREGASEAAESVAAGPRSGARNSLTATGNMPSKAERQKAALERLRNSAKRKPSLSPPRTRQYIERDRSRSRNKRGKGFILSGGIR